MFGGLGTLLWGALGAFHVWLVADHAWNGEVHPEDVVRWVSALGVAGALVTLWRRGVPLLADRRATAVWVLAAVLHGPGLAENANLAARVLAEVPTVAVVCLSAGLGLVLVLAARGRRAPAPAGLATAVAVAPRPIRTLDAHMAAGFLPRPPPAV